VRVIAGELKGRRLEVPSWEGLRPTSDKLRETLFNVLTTRVAGADVLDAYAGTGAVGIEALSRGAAHVTFVDSDPRAARLIEANLGRLGVRNRYAIIRAGLADAVRQLRAQRFDIIFLDPPYAPTTLADALSQASELAAADTVIVLEHAARDAAPASAGALTRVRELKSGDSALSFFRRAHTGPLPTQGSPEGSA
jgi:16S rRNA (guanine(966)-N(2))-methyltransferase RsmD